VLAGDGAEDCLLERGDAEARGEAQLDAACEQAAGVGGERDGAAARDDARLVGGRRARILQLGVEGWIDSDQEGFEDPDRVLQARIEGGDAGVFGVEKVALEEDGGHGEE